MYQYITKIFKITVSLFVLIFLFVLNLQSETLYLIHNGPLTMGSPSIPNETIIYRLNEETEELEQVWSLGENKEAWSIAIYPSANMAVIVEDRWKPQFIHIFSLDNINQMNTIALGKNGRFLDYHYYQTENADDQIEVNYLDEIKDNIPSFKFLNYSINGQELPEDDKNNEFEGEIRLAGPRASGGSEHDLISFHGIPAGKSKAMGTNRAFIASPIPDGVIQQGSSRGWNLIVNEPNFYALISIPDRNDQSHRELLIYNRITENWNSILLEGGVTAPRLINNWLAGTIKNMNPESDYDNPHGKAFPAIVGEDVILINPLEGRYFKGDLGPGGEVIWIEDNIVYYRIGQELYKALIENNSFVNPTMLVSDFKVRFIHWAFTSKMPQEIKHKNIE